SRQLLGPSAEPVGNEEHLVRALAGADLRHWLRIAVERLHASQETPSVPRGPRRRIGASNRTAADRVDAVFSVDSRDRIQKSQLLDGAAQALELGTEHLKSPYPL